MYEKEYEEEQEDGAAAAPTNSLGFRTCSAQRGEVRQNQPKVAGREEERRNPSGGVKRPEEGGRMTVGERKALETQGPAHHLSRPGATAVEVNRPQKTQN